MHNRARGERNRPFRDYALAKRHGCCIILDGQSVPNRKKKLAYRMTGSCGCSREDENEREIFRFARKRGISCAVS